MEKQISTILDVMYNIVDGISKNYSNEEINSLIINNSKYDKNIVAAIFSWIFEKQKKNYISGKKFHKTGFRILSKKEIEILGLQQSSYVMRLYNLRILNENDLESIIELTKGTGEEQISDKNINLLVLSIILDSESNVLPGSRYLLYSSDLIN